jgi:hypothetical protein
MTVAPTSPSTVRAVPSTSIKVILTMLEGDRWKRKPVAGEEWRRKTPAGGCLLSAHAAQRQSLTGETVDARN